MKIIINEFPTHIEKTDNKVAPNKFIKLNNQSIYNGALHRFSRNTVMSNLHKYLKPYITGFLINKSSIVYPLSVNIKIYTVRNHGSISMRSHKLCWKPPKPDYKPNWDIENLASIWIKAINDTLTSVGVIKDDSVQFINKITYEFIEVEKLEDRKLEIHLNNDNKNL